MTVGQCKRLRQDYYAKIYNFVSCQVKTIFARYPVGILKFTCVKPRGNCFNFIAFNVHLFYQARLNYLNNFQRMAVRNSAYLLRKYKTRRVFRVD